MGGSSQAHFPVHSPVVEAPLERRVIPSPRSTASTVLLLFAHPFSSFPGPADLVWYRQQLLPITFFLLFPLLPGSLSTSSPSSPHLRPFTASPGSPTLHHFLFSSVPFRPPTDKRVSLSGSRKKKSGSEDPAARVDFGPAPRFHGPHLSYFFRRRVSRPRNVDTDTKALAAPLQQSCRLLPSAFDG